MNRSDQPALAIIGAGIVGLCAAMQAQSQGYAVTLMDKSPPGEGASFGNAGFLATEYMNPLATPENILRAPIDLCDPAGFLFLRWPDIGQIMPWLVRFVLQARPKLVALNHDALSALNSQSLPAWRRLLGSLDLRGELIDSGYLQVWESGDESKALQHQEDMASYGVETHVVSRADLRALEPALSDTIRHGLRFPLACRMQDPYLLCQKLFKHFMAKGGQFIQAAVTDILPEAEAVRINLEVSEQGRSLEQFQADKVLVAAGAYSCKLIKPLGVSVPLIAERGYHITLPAQQGLLSHTVGFSERRVVLSPLVSGLRIVGISELAKAQSKASRRPWAVLSRHLQAALPTLPTETIDQGIRWMGRRPTLPDSLPVVDVHPRDSRILFAFGHQHLGLTQAAVTAELLAFLLGKGKPSDNTPDYHSLLKPLRVSRF